MSALLCAASALCGQTLSFDVASVKASEPITPAMLQSGKVHSGMKIDNKRVDIGNFSLLQLICKAYDVKTYQVTGPEWLTANMGISQQRFDIVANLPDGTTKEQVPQMLQTLLAERFKVKLHKDSKEQPVYALVVAKGGLKMKQSAAAAPPAEGEQNPAVTGSNTVSVNQTKGGAEFSDGSGKSQKMVPAADGKSMRFEMTGFTVAELAEGLTPLVDHPIVDTTGVAGKYDAVIDISMGDLLDVARKVGQAIPASTVAALGEAAEPTGSIFTSLQALGLKLEPRKMPMTLLVVDSAEKAPTEN
ncbi:MAG: TIGR03435 family protein [Candidatus Solibacter sp.]